MTAHKHRDLIIAWANGSQIQCFDCGHWYDCPNPAWGELAEYRIKPEEKTSLSRTTMRLNLDLLIERDGPIAYVVGAEVVK